MFCVFCISVFFRTLGWVRLRSFFCWTLLRVEGGYLEMNGDSFCFLVLLCFGVFGVSRFGGI